MQTLELLQLEKGTSRGEVTLISEAIKAVAIAIIKLLWHESISKSVS